MKKNAILLFFALTIGTAVVLTTGCSKDDTTAPVVTLTGASDITLSLNSSAWADLGATANDEADGVTTVSSDASLTNPNVNHTGVYTITYSSTDAAGNVGTAVRTITVKNDAEAFAGTYSVDDTTGGGHYVFPQSITYDEEINNRVHFSRFNDYANNTNIYATRLPNGNLEIPSQTALQIGTGTVACDVADHTFQSVNFVSSTTGFSLSFTDVNLCNSSSLAFGQIFTKQ